MSVTINGFHPQAFLFYKDFISNSLKKSSLKPKKEEMSIHKIVGRYEPTAVVSSVYNGKGASGNSIIKQNFFDLEPHKISALVPELRFFKVEEDGTFVPFYMPIAALGSEAVSLNTPSRIGAAMVKSFSVKYEGTDPFQAPRYLSADLQLYVDNLQNIFAPPPEPGYATLADIFTISISSNKKIKAKGAGGTVTPSELVKPIEIAATLGYTLKNRDIFTQQEVDEILSSNLSLRMNVFNHTINMNQDGTATIDISYTARINNAGRDKIFSALDAPEDLLARADIRQLFASKSKKAGEVDPKKAALETKYKKQEDKIAEVRRILEILEARNKIYTIRATKEDLHSYSLLGLLPKIEEARKKIAENESTKSSKDSSTSSRKQPQGQPEPPKDEYLEYGKPLDKKIKDLDMSERELHYITFGDLLEAFLIKVKVNLESTLELIKNADTKEGKAKLTAAGMYQEFMLKTPEEREKIKSVIVGALKKTSTFKILLSDITYKHFTSKSLEADSVRRINIGDIPISLYTYQQFMYDNIVNKDRNTFVIPQFLQSCLKSGGLLDKCFSEWSRSGIAPNLISEPPDFSSIVLSGPQLKASVGKKQFLAPRQVPSALKSTVPLKVEEECDYFLIYQTPKRSLVSPREGNKSKDSKKGIYHFHIGNNRGLMKNVTFQKYDILYQKEALMTNQVGLYDELKMQYKANIDMHGNNLFFPGSVLFLDPGSIGFGNPQDFNSAAYKLGLGGYYVVISVQTTINNGVATTSLGCMFETRADGVPTNLELEFPFSVAGQIPSAKSESPDTTGKPNQNIRRELIADKGLYYRQLANLKDPETSQPILDPRLAEQISIDFQTRPADRPERILSVVSRQVSKDNKSVIYHLMNGKSVKIERIAGDNAVTLVENSKTFPYEKK